MFSRAYQNQVNEVYQLENPFLAKLIRFHFLEGVFHIYASAKVRGYRSILFNQGNHFVNLLNGSQVTAKIILLDVAMKPYLLALNEPLPVDSIYHSLMFHKTARLKTFTKLLGQKR